MFFERGETPYPFDAAMEYPYREDETTSDVDDLEMVEGEDGKVEMRLPERFIIPLNVVTHALRGQDYRLGGSAANALHGVNTEITRVNDLDVYTDGPGIAQLEEELAGTAGAILTMNGYRIEIQDVDKFGPSRRIAIYDKDNNDVVEIFGETEAGTLQMWNTKIGLDDAHSVRVHGVDAEVQVLSKEDLFRQYLIVAAYEFGGDLEGYLKQISRVRTEGDIHVDEHDALDKERTKFVHRFTALYRLLYKAEPGMVDGALHKLAQYDYSQMPPELEKRIQDLTRDRDLFLPESFEAAEKCDDCLNAEETVALLEEIGGTVNTRSGETRDKQFARLALVNLEAVEDMDDGKYIDMINTLFHRATMTFAGAPKIFAKLFETAQKIADRNSFPSNIYFRAFAHVGAERLLALTNSQYEQGT